MRKSAKLRCVPSPICKPSSVVYGHLSGRTVAGAFKRYSRQMPGEQPYAALAQSCTERGLHGTLRYRNVGELLPPLSILTGKPAVCFCCTVLEVASTGRYPASCSAVLGLSSRLAPRDRMINSEYLQLYSHGNILSTILPLFGFLYFSPKHLSFATKKYIIYT